MRKLHLLVATLVVAVAAGIGAVFAFGGSGATSAGTKHPAAPAASKPRPAGTARTAAVP